MSRSKTPPPWLAPAKRQLYAEAPTPGSVTPDDPRRGDANTDGSTPVAPKPPSGPGVTPAKKLVRYHGCVVLDPARAGRDASRIAEKEITHLAGLDGAAVTVTLEISAEIPAGAPDHVVHIVTENGRTLKFTIQGFESQ